MNLYAAVLELMEDYRRKGWKAGWEASWKRGRKEGLKRGLKKGKREERISIIKNMIREKTDEEYIRNITGCSDKELSLAEES